MNLTPEKSSACILEIVALTAAGFAEQFQAGDRGDPDWVTKCLYEYQQNPNPKYLVAEIEQDIVWEALRIQPDTTTWGITAANYDVVMRNISQTWVGIRAITKTDK
jgi:hypothetical protein